MKSVKPESILIYSDIDGHKMNSETIPADILTKKLRPDLVLISRLEKIIDILELSYNFEKNLEKANIFKNERISRPENGPGTSWMENIFSTN